MEKVNLTRVLLDIERDYVLKAMQASTNGMTGAAELLGIKRTSLYEKLNRLDIAFRIPKKARIVDEKESSNKALLMVHPNNIEHQLWNE